MNARIPFLRFVLFMTVLWCFTGATTLAQITVTSPNGGEAWALGSTHDITWTQTGLQPDTDPGPNFVEIEYTDDGGSNWYTVTTSLDLTDGSKTYSWSIPSTLPSSGSLTNNTISIRISERIIGDAITLPGHPYIDASNADFNIFGVPTLLTPTDALTGVSRTPTLTWTTDVLPTSAVQNRLEASSSSTLSGGAGSSFSTTVYGTLLPAGAQANVVSTTLDYGTTYYWHVKNIEVDVPNDESLYADPFSFTTLLTDPVATDETSVGTTSFTANWDAIPGVTKYRLDVATDAGFTSKVGGYDDLDVGTVTTFLVNTGLAENTHYYYRVRAEFGPAAANGTSGNSNTIDLYTLPTAPTLLTPLDGATAVALTDNLTWGAKASPVDAYYLELSTVTPGGTVVFEGNLGNVTSYNLAGLLNNTTYYWRIQAHNPQTWGPYSAFFSFTTKLATPNPSSPADAATGVSLAPILEWDAVTNADNYRLEVNTASGFDGSVIYDNAALTTNSKQIGGLSDNVTYYWRVTATNSGGNTSEVSGVFSFTTERTTLTSPADNAVFVSSPSTTLSWPVTTGADKYRLEVNTASGFDGTVIFDDAALTTNSQVVGGIIGLNNNAYYFWRVTAMSNALAKAATSTVYQFHTKLATPVLTSPTDGSTAHPLTLTLDWSAVDGATTYYVVVATDAGFTSKVFESYDVSPNQQVISGLSSLTTYYWKVRARSSASSDSSDISSTFNFKTTGFSVDQLPVPSWPIGGATVYTTTPTLNWYLGFATYAPVKYSLQYSTDASYTDPAQVVRVSDITDLNYAIATQLTAGVTYHWRVKIHTTDDLDSTDYCNSVSFVVSPTASGTTVAPKPIASWPVGGATVYTTDPTLNWYLGTSSAGLTFSLFYTTDPAYGTFTRVNGITDLNYALSGLTPGATYHWRVKSFSATDSSDYSDDATFVVNSTAGGGGTAPKPIASWPIGGATVYSTSPTLNWYLGSDATGLTYSLFYTTDPAYGTFTRVNGITELSYALSGLTPGETYHWRVKSFSATDSSDYSDNVTFVVNSASGTTVAPKPVASWPIGGATVYSTAPSLSWYLNTSSAGLTFSLFYTTDPAYGTFTRVNGITDLSYALSGLTPGTTYHWRVKSFSATDSSDYSDDVTFVVDNSSSGGTSPKPINSWPVGGATVFTLTPTFNWYLLTGTSGTITYELEVVLFPGSFTGSGITGISGNTFTYPSSLTAGTAYQWRVRLISTVTGTSDWSDVSTFSTYTPSGSVAAPLLGDPIENVSIFSPTASLSWYLTTKPADIQKYRVEVAKNKDMVNPIIQIDNIEGFTKAVSSLTSGTYFWRVQANTNDGKYSNYSNVGSFQITGVTAVDNEKNVIPESFTVSQNYPNPFNPSTIIKFGLPEASFVSLKIYNVLGQEVKNLLNDQKNAGTYSVQWNGDNNFGHKVSSGTYIYRIVAGNNVSTKKMILMK